MGRVFFPLDEELGLLPGTLSPTVQESLTRLATWLPFTPTGKMLAHFIHVLVPEATIRRITERVGAAYVALQTEQVAEIEEEAPAPMQGPPVQQISADGAMVPLVGGEWAEVKTMAIGTVVETTGDDGTKEIHATDLSYFSRLTDAETFTRMALVETQRRGLETAGRVCGVMDGADWEQGFLDFHRPDARRILDFPHAAEYLTAAAQAVWGAGTSETSAWLDIQLHTLRHGDPQEVLSALRALQTYCSQASSGVPSGATTVVAKSLAYLEKRKEQIRYADFQAEGFPIGSGIVESANKLVVEARLKGAGMHWAREHVNPMVALRTIACSDRWEEAWPQIRRQIAEERRQRAQQRRRDRQAATASPVPEAPVVETTVQESEAPPAPESDDPIRLADSVTDDSKAEPGDAPRDHRPAANHPWRRSPVSRAAADWRANRQPARI